VAFCAYLLPRREAVWWACGCTRSFLGGERPARLRASIEEAIKLAETGL
jgi:hypothetical protein